MLLIIIWYFFHNYFWPRPRTHSSGLGLVALASASRLWPRLTSLMNYITFLEHNDDYYYYYLNIPLDIL